MIIKKKGSDTPFAIHLSVEQTVLKNQKCCLIDTSNIQRVDLARVNQLINENLTKNPQQKGDRDMPIVSDENRKLKFRKRYSAMKDDKWCVTFSSRYIQLKLKKHSCLKRSTVYAIEDELEKIELEFFTRFGTQRAKELLGDLNEEHYLAEDDD